MDESDPDRQLPTVAFPSQPAREEQLHHVAIVLPETPDASIENTTGANEGLADERAKAVDQHAGDERGEYRHRVRVEGANPRAEGIVVEPGRIGRRGVQKERAQRLRRTAQDLFLLIHAGPDEAGSLLRVQ